MGTVPGIRTGPNGKQKLTLSATIPEDEPYPSMNEAADAFYGPRLGSLLLEGLRRELAAPLKSRIGSLERRMGKIEADKRRCEGLAERLEEGELLKGNLRRVKKGMEQIKVRDWSTGRDRVLSLDPALDAIQNMEKIFRASAKGKRGETIVQERIRQTTEELRALQDLLFFVEDAQDVDELNRLVDDLPAVVTHRASPEPAKTRVRDHTPSPFRAFRSSGGRDALVGKSARGNDVLLREKARPGDLWFHVKGVAGAHVLMPVRGKDQPSALDIAFGAGLAVHFSRARGKGKVEVILAEVKDIGRPKGALPGQVTVRRYRTMLSDGLEPGQVEESGKAQD
jgi:predicted ribosome quality control (RQC) complex YloA/Tae2 family protein